MSPTVGIAINLIADIGLLGLLAWAMSRPAKLRSHEPAAANVDVVQLRRGPTVEVQRQRRAA
jgi:hypothetical protein